MISLPDTLRDIFFPRRCPLCGKIIAQKGKLACGKCEKDLVPVSEPRCKKCSKPLLNEEQEYCFDCVKSGHHYKRGFALYLYQGAVKDSLMKLKFFGRREYADFYVEKLADYYGEWILKLSIDMIIPVPLHKRKKRMRGYNQAELLARGLAKRLNLPVHTDWLIRTRFTLPQKKLSNTERLKNLTQAFEISAEENYHRNDFYQARVLLVDDIYTTGSTIEACTRQLLAAGCKEVYFVTVCIGKGL